MVPRYPEYWIDEKQRQRALFSESDNFGLCVRARVCQPRRAWRCALSKPIDQTVDGGRDGAPVRHHGEVGIRRLERRHRQPDELAAREKILNEPAPPERDALAETRGLDRIG